MNEEHVTCKEVMKHICESLGEDLNSDRCAAIKTHLGDCPGCKNYFKTVEMTIDFYKKYNITLPDEAHSRLMEKLGLTDLENK